MNVTDSQIKTDVHGVNEIADPVMCFTNQDKTKPHKSYIFYTIYLCAFISQVSRLLCPTLALHLKSFCQKKLCIVKLVANFHV